MLTEECDSGDYMTKQMDVGCVWTEGIPEPPSEEEEASRSWTSDQWDAFYAKQPKRLPEALPSYDGSLDIIIKTTESLKDRSIQVIVKLANIVLTPEKPEYGGGTWHVEATRNEQIVSTFIYYYDELNITESRLAFRTAINEPVDHCQVQPFKLADHSKPGHRKILALFLVDPSRPVLSATTVSPGQREWYERAAASTDRVKGLPVELRQLIFDAGIDGTMSREEAEKVRLELMQERSAGSSEFSRGYGVHFSLCEH